MSGSAKKYTRDTSNKYEDVIDVDFYEVSVPNVPTAVVTSGRQYVSGLLESPRVSGLLEAPRKYD